MPTPIEADAQGVVKGRFKIPKNIKAGTKQVKFIGDHKGHAETTFTGQGTVVTNTMRQVKNIQQSYYDPLAQTFMLTQPRQLSGVNIWLVTKGTTPLIVQLRETSVGFPSRTIIAEGRVEQNSSLTDGSWVKVSFDTPFYASANIEYAVVVLANDAQTEVGISELGKPDLGPGGGYVTQQPYQVGVLLSSANASTWTAHQDKDLTFQLLARKYDASKPKSIILGQITLAADTTDLLISALTSTPATGADADLWLLEMDPANKTDISKAKSKRMVSDGQIVKFNQPTSGLYTVVANLRCTDYASATIDPGTQIIQGVMSDKGTYITRNFRGDKNAAVALTVTIENIGGGTITVDYANAKTDGKPYAPADWVSVPQVPQAPGTSAQNAAGRDELMFKTTIAQGKGSDDMKLRLTISGTADHRPQFFNLRVSVV